MDFEVFAINRCEESPQEIVLRLSGEFDLVCEPALQDALDGLCQGSDRSLVVDVSEAQFMGVGALRRIVLVGRGFASTTFRSPVPIVETVLRVLGFVDGTVRIEGGASRAGAPWFIDEAPSMGRCSASPRIAAENEWPGSRGSQQRSGARGVLKHRIVGSDRSGTAPAMGQDAYSSQQSLEQK
jgi:hypothetical protein